MSKENNLPFVLTNEDKVSVKDREIEEMAKIIYDNRPIPEIWQEDAEEIAHILYKAGYREQSEGEWIRRYSKHTDHLGTFMKYDGDFCSVCGELGHGNYCPNCGAKMKGGE